MPGGFQENVQENPKRILKKLIQLCQIFLISTYSNAPLSQVPQNGLKGAAYLRAAVAEAVWEILPETLTVTRATVLMPPQLCSNAGFFNTFPRFDFQYEYQEPALIPYTYLITFRLWYFWGLKSFCLTSHTSEKCSVFVETIGHHCKTAFKESPVQYSATYIKSDKFCWIHLA